MDINSKAPFNVVSKTLETVVSINPENLDANTSIGFKFQYIDISSVHQGVIDWSTVTTQTLLTAPSRARRVIRPNDILLCTVRPALQSHAFVDWKNNENYICSTGFAVLRVSSSIESRYLYHLIFHPIIADQLKKLEIGSNYPAVNETAVRQLLIPAPTIDEQRLIANILDILDIQIQQTEQLVAKLKQMKAGLLHDLLTRGIDENGEMRDPVEHPEQFKEEYFLQKRIKLPKKWEIVTLGSIIKQEGGKIQTGPFGSQLHAYEYVSDGNPVIMPQDIEDGHISTAKIARISLVKTEKLARHRVEFNDVIFARRGDISRCASITAKEFDWLCGTGCLLVKLPKKILYGPWLANVYRHDYSQRQILARAVGSTMINLNTKLLSNLVIMQACYHEQVAITTKIEAHDARITAEETELAKLKQLKKGLMHDLLTGHVRVTPLMAESEQLDVQLKSVTDCK